MTLPVLLQYPAGQLQGPRPRIGASGKCDNDHLLDIRNDPANPSFIAWSRRDCTTTSRSSQPPTNSDWGQPPARGMHPSNNGGRMALSSKQSTRR